MRKSFSTNDAGTVGHPQAKKKKKQPKNNRKPQPKPHTLYKKKKKPLNRSHTEM